MTYCAMCDKPFDESLPSFTVGDMEAAGWHLYRRSWYCGDCHPRRYAEQMKELKRERDGT